MLEYFAYKKVKQHRAEQAASSSQPKPVLAEEDEEFLRRLAEEGPPPALPERPYVFSEGDEAGNSQVTHSRNVDQEPEHHHSHHDGHGSKDKGKGKAEEEGIQGKLSKQGEKITGKVAALFGKSTKVTKEGLHPEHQVPPAEVEKEEDDIAKILNDLNMSAVNNRAFSLSKESNELVQRFTLVLKDLVNGAPHAYDDLVNLLDDSQGTLAKSYDSMPSFMQKLVTTLPEKLTSQLAPELLAVASEAQGLNKGGAAAYASGSKGGGLAGAAKSFLTPSSLKDLVTKPGAVAGMLKAIMNTLKLRWPAFMGTNVLLSLGLFVLLFVFWYCHKRGREVRLGKDGKVEVVDSEGRIVELEDDPQLADRPHGERRHGERSDDSAQASGSSSRRHHGHRSSGSSHRSRRSHRSSEREGHHSRRNGGQSSDENRHQGYVSEQVGSHHAHGESTPRNDTTERLDGLVQDAASMRVEESIQSRRDDRVYEQVVHEDRLRDEARRGERDHDRHDRHDRQEKR